MNLYASSFGRLVERLEEKNYYIPQSSLKKEVWTVFVNPRPLIIFRIRYDAPSQQLVVSRRNPFIYREILRKTLNETSAEEAIGEVLALIGAPRMKRSIRP